MKATKQEQNLEYKPTEVIKNEIIKTNTPKRGMSQILSDFEKNKKAEEKLISEMKAWFIG